MGFQAPQYQFSRLLYDKCIREVPCPSGTQTRIMYRVRDLNPCYRRERPASWTPRRTRHSNSIQPNRGKRVSGQCVSQSLTSARISFKADQICVAHCKEHSEMNYHEDCLLRIRYCTSSMGRRAVCPLALSTATYKPFGKPLPWNTASYCPGIWRCCTSSATLRPRAS